MQKYILAIKVHSSKVFLSKKRVLNHLKNIISYVQTNQYINKVSFYSLQKSSTKTKLQFEFAKVWSLSYIGKKDS